ncbi:hypothetical protein BDZ89DRAFT_1121612 [Hymenopellis radicata]|nr:hypothetical protein BDZ89DRAFT_1121612 [Hymenopellis radicata]
MTTANPPPKSRKRGILDVPYEGTFVAFSVDPAATLRYYCQGGDSVAKDLVDKLPWKQYAGYCTQWHGFPDQHAEFNRIGLRPVQIGLTKPRPNCPDKFKHRTPDMCVPILPATEHPLGRPPLPISRPLPWDNCYQTTLDDFDVLVAPENHDYSNSPEFSGGTDYDISCYTSEDAKRIDAIDAESRGLPCDELNSHTASESLNRSDSVSIQSDAYAPSVTDDVEAVEDIFFSSTDDPMWNKIFTPAVKVNPDLGIIKVLSDPAELWDEHAALKRIVDECKARRRAGSRSQKRSQGMHAILSSGFLKIVAKFKRTRSKIVRVFGFKTVKWAV